MHSGRWVDGAFVFVAVSGFVTGLVHRRIRVDRGARASNEKLLRRSGRIYVVHIFLCLISIMIVSSFRQAHLANTPTWGQMGGILETISRVASFRIEPNYNEILPLYVVFLLVAIGVLYLLDRRMWWAVLGLSAVVYVLGSAVQGVAMGPNSYWVTSWQALFVLGLVVGWSWEHERRQIPLAWRRRTVMLCVAGAMGFFLLARLAPAATVQVLGRTLGKRGGGPAAFTFAACVIVAAYVGVRHALHAGWVDRLLLPVRVLGAKGLPGYCAMVISLAILGAFPTFPINDVTVVVVITICGLTEYAALGFDHYRRTSRLRAEPPRPSVLIISSAPTPVSPQARTVALDYVDRHCSEAAAVPVPMRSNGGPSIALDYVDRDSSDARDRGIARV